MNTMFSQESLSRNNFIKEESNALGILVISNELFSKQLCEALTQYHKQKSNKYKLYLITCAHINEILCHTNFLNIDYVVFLVDTRIKTSGIDIECNLQKMHKSFLCGRICIVNANPHISHSDMNMPMETFLGLKLKYNIFLLNGDVMDPNGCSNLAQRLLILIETNLGIKQKYPFFPWLNQN